MREYYVSHLLSDDEMKRIIKEIPVGVESIEFSISENLDHLEETLENYKRRLEYMDGRALSIHGPFLDLNPMSFDSMVQEATRVRYEQAYSAARELGAKKIVFHSGFIPSVNFVEGWAERMTAFYERFLADKPADIQILMENVLDPAPEPLLEVAESISHPAFGICLDVGHVHCYSEVPCMEWVKTLEKHILHLHIHDNAGYRDSHLAFGYGTLPVQELKRWMEQHPEVSGTFECRSVEDVMASYRRLV